MVFDQTQHRHLSDQAWPIQPKIKNQVPRALANTRDGKNAGVAVREAEAIV